MARKIDQVALAVFFLTLVVLFVILILTIPVNGGNLLFRAAAGTFVLSGFGVIILSLILKIGHFWTFYILYSAAFLLLIMIIFFILIRPNTQLVLALTVFWSYINYFYFISLIPAAVFSFARWKNSKP